MSNRPGVAEIHAERAREARYDDTSQLLTLIGLHRDRSLMDIVRQGRRAREQADVLGIQKAIDALKQHHNAQLPTVQALIADFSRSVTSSVETP